MSGLKPKDPKDNRRRVASRPVQVLLTTAAGVIFDLVGSALEKDPGFSLLPPAKSGMGVITGQRTNDADVVIYDIGAAGEKVDTVLAAMLRADPNAKILMVSTLTFGNVKAGMQGLLDGAADYMATPAYPDKRSNRDAFRRALVRNAMSLGLAHRAGAPTPVAPPPSSSPDIVAKPRMAAPSSSARVMAPVAAPVGAPVTAHGAIHLRAASIFEPDVLVIAASTGGPKALIHLFEALPSTLRQPVLIAQHMPPTFTALLAEHISRDSGWHCAEAKDGEPIIGNRAYIAPGDYHMEVTGRATKPVLRLHQGPRINFCRPAADPLLQSVAEVYGPRVLTVILTGMGHDGAEGGAAIAEAGGTVIAQDEASSVVWGMPGAAATAGICSAVLPLDDIPLYMAALATGQKPPESPTGHPAAPTGHPAAPTGQ